MQVAVADSSTLILLARIGFLDKLYLYSEAVLVPQAVFDEAVISGKNMLARLLI